MERNRLFLLSALIMIVAVFTACEEDEVFDPPLVLTTEGGTIVLDEGVTEYTLSGTVQSQAGLSEVKLLEVIDGDYFLLNSVTSFADPNLYSFNFTITGIEDEITVVVEATDTEFQTNSSDPVKIVYTPVPETPLAEAVEAEWKRVAGAAGTGLDMFGLSWTSNLKAVMAVIAKDNADKFVQLDETAWVEIETLEALSEAVEAADDMDDYREVSAEADAEYSDVLATQVGEDYFLILVKSATVVYDAQIGTTITISIEYKTVEQEEE